MCQSIAASLSIEIITYRIPCKRNYLTMCECNSFNSVKGWSSDCESFRNLTVKLKIYLDVYLCVFSFHYFCNKAYPTLIFLEKKFKKTYSYKCIITKAFWGLSFMGNFFLYHILEGCIQTNTTEVFLLLLLL